VSSLVLRRLSVARGGRGVVTDVSLEIPAGEVTALLGANGAGKSSLVLGVAGRLRLSSGAVLIDGVDVAGQRPQRIRRSGLAAVPEGHQVLRSLSVRDNLRAAVLDARREDAMLTMAYELLPELASIEQRLAGSCSGGQQQMVAIAQALVSEPRYLLIDELSLGLAPIIVDRLISVVAAIAEQGIGVLLIEQYATVALAVATHAAVLDRGQLEWAGTAAELREHPEILHGVYLGTAHPA